jgi:NADH-quinone oxidoreductase subunit H
MSKDEWVSRIDGGLMRIGWKVFLPMSLTWVVIVAFLAKFEVFGGFWARWAVGG